MNSSAIFINNLTVVYNNQPVLWQLTIAIQPGVCLAIVGPNGAGKTTLMKTLLGLIEPVAGIVTFFGKPFKEIIGKIAYIPQRSTVDWDFPLTVLDVVLMGRYRHIGWFKRPSADDYQRAHKAIAQVNLSAFTNIPINQLSGGQQQRVFLARALVQDADIYLLDEPFAAVDIATEKNIISILLELRSQGKTVVVIHHDLQTVADYFDWVLLLNVEKIAYGPVHQVFKPEYICIAYGADRNLFSYKKKMFFDTTLIIILLGMSLIGATAGALGVFVLLRGQSLMGDALSHAALPGVSLMFLFSQNKNPLVLLVGGLMSSVIGIVLVRLITTRTHLKLDTALGLVLSVFFGLGLMLLTIIQKLPIANQAVLSTFLFGNASVMLHGDLLVLLIIAITVAIAFFVCWKELKLMTFDAAYAHANGYSLILADVILTGLLICLIALSLQSVGVILMSSLLIAPATAARQWVNRLEGMLVLSVFFGAIAGVIGSGASSVINHLPTGPAIVVVASIMVVFSILKTGVLVKIT